MTEIDKKLLEEVVNHNKKVIKKYGGDANKAIDNIFILEHEGYSIWNPFMDETMRFEVVPEEKYGLKKLEKLIDDYKKTLE